MGARFRLSDQLKALEARSNELKHELNSLRASKRHLLLRQALTSCWADTMSFVQLCLANRDCEHAPDGGQQQQQQQQSHAKIRQPADDSGLLASLLRREVELLQQLSSSESGLEQQPTLKALLEPGEVETISPCTDPMSYLQNTISQSPLPEAEHMTATDLATYMQKAVLSVSIKLHKSLVVPPWDRMGIMTEITDIWDRFFLLFVSFITAGRQAVLEAAHVLNLETLQPEPAEAAEHQLTQAAVLVPLLGLSEQQQEFIAVGMRLSYDLNASILQERQDVQTQLAACEEGMACSQPDRADSRSAACSNGASLASLAQLEKQQGLTNRLNSLLHKEYMLRMTAMGWFVGCLSCEQLSRLAVCCWPYAPRVLFLGTEIMQQREKLVQTRTQMCV